MQTFAEYLNTMTVKALREIAAQLGYTGTSKMIKAKLVEIVDTEASFAYDDAVTENRKRVVTKIVKSKSAIDRMTNRINGYMRANDTDKLTKPQLRRIRKKSNRTGVNPWRLALTYP